jgi:hypothetical protein
MDEINREVQNSPVEQVSAARREIVDRARQLWIKRLIDLSRRNNLLYFRDLKTGTLDISTADPDRMVELLSGEAARPVPSCKNGSVPRRLRTAILLAGPTSGGIPFAGRASQTWILH